MKLTLAPIDPQRQGPVMLPSIRAHLAEFFEGIEIHRPNLPTAPALGSPISSELLLPPMNRRERESYTPRPAVFPGFLQRGSRIQFHAGYRPAGEHLVVGIRAPVVRFATPIVPSRGTSQSTQVSSDSDCSLDDSPEMISAARVLYEMRRGLAKEDNYYNSDADEDEDDSPVEEYSRNLKRTRTGGIKTQGTAGVASTVEETSDAVDTEIDRSFNVVQGREDQTSKLGVWPSPTKRPRLDTPKTFHEIRAAIRGAIRFQPPTSVRVEQVANDENAHLGDSTNNGEHNELTSLIRKPDGLLPRCP